MKIKNSSVFYKILLNKKMFSYFLTLLIIVVENKLNILVKKKNQNKMKNIWKLIRVKSLSFQVLNKTIKIILISQLKRRKRKLELF